MPIELQLLIALAIAAASSAGTWQVQNWRYAAKDKERLEAQIVADRGRVHAAHQGSETHESDKIFIETKFETLYRDSARAPKAAADLTCFTDDFMREHAAGVQLTGNTGQPGPPLPAASAAGK